MVDPNNQQSQPAPISGSPARENPLSAATTRATSAVVDSAKKRRDNNMKVQSQTGRVKLFILVRILFQYLKKVDPGLVDIANDVSSVKNSVKDSLLLDRKA